jgi:hypothetical protein
MVVMTKSARVFSRVSCEYTSLLFCNEIFTYMSLSTWEH